MDGTKNKTIDLMSDVSSDQEVLGLLKTSKFDLRRFNQELGEDKTEEALYLLLDMQSDEKPLKKGGPSVAYRCDLLIQRNRQRFTGAENTLFDLILGYVSSHPHDEDYYIYPKDIKKLMPYSDNKYIYKLLHGAVESILTKPLLFEMDGRKLAMPWYEALSYETGGYDEDMDNAYIYLRPSKFFRMLAISATVTHGAYYKIGVSARIQSNFTKNLFYLLESRKRYKALDCKEQGTFQISLSDLQMLLGYPVHYKPHDIIRRVLEPAKKIINGMDNCDFSFDFDMRKSKPDLDGQKKYTQYTHVLFLIKTKNINTNPDVIDDKIDNNGDELLYTMLKQVDISDPEKELVIRKYREYNRDVDYLMTAIRCVNNSTRVQSKAAVLQWIMEHDITAQNTIKTNMANNGQYSFVQHDDYPTAEEWELLVDNNTLTEEQKKRREELLKKWS